MKKKRPEEYSTACIEEGTKFLLEDRQEIWKATISKDHTGVKLSVKFSSTYFTTTVKLITYLIVDLHCNNCLIERIPMLKIIFFNKMFKWTSKFLRSNGIASE